MQIAGFLGPSNRDRIGAWDIEETINLFPRLRDGGKPKSQVELIRRPGLYPFVGLGVSPVRALFAQDGRAFGISGDRFVEFFASQTFEGRGTVAVDGNPAHISSNGVGGDQLFIVSGGSGYLFELSTNTFTPIADEDFPAPALMGGYLDGYFLALKTHSIEVYFSALLDGEDWNALDFLAISQYSDMIQAIAINNRELWCFGSKHTQVWVNTGDALVPFQPLDASYQEAGCAAPFSVAQLDNTIFWLAGDERGSRRVMKAQGYTPLRVSTHAIEYYLNTLARVSDAIGFSFQMEGHAFYALYLPAADTTLLYDVATQMWMKWAQWDTVQSVWHPLRARCHTYAFDTHLVGDRTSGTVYALSLDRHTDTLSLL